MRQRFDISGVIFVMMREQHAANGHRLRDCRDVALCAGKSRVDHGAAHDIHVHRVARHPASIPREAKGCDIADLCPFNHP
jgi:hypothetical protein